MISRFTVSYHLTFENFREMYGFSALLTSPNPSRRFASPSPSLSYRRGKGRVGVGMGEVKREEHQKHSYVR